ncbi:serine hydrolase family protein [Candidatus Woesearchaeota archaeon]|nr:serine hydrolase family protein [Candidatus Woesearchaeota archaeon]
MVKRVFVIHCWGGSPQEHWYEWLAGELEKEGFKTYVPRMPDTEHPRIEAWVPFLEKLVGTLDKETFFVGHSIGCATILRYLENVKEKVGGVVLVAGFFEITWPNPPSEEDIKLMTPWLKPYNLAFLKKQNIIGIFSDNDPWIPVMNAELFKQKLNAKVIVEHKQGHYSAGMKSLRTALDSVLELAK